MRLALLLTLGFLTACTPTAPPGPSRIDELAYYEALLDRRPVLMVQHEGSVNDPAWLALVAHPELREPLLTDASATFDTLLDARFDEETQAREQVWAEGLRAGQRAMSSTAKVRPYHSDDRIYVAADPGVQ